MLIWDGQRLVFVFGREIGREIFWMKAMWSRDGLGESIPITVAANLTFWMSLNQGVQGSNPWSRSKSVGFAFR